MKLILTITEVEDLTVGELRRIIFVIEKLGYYVEVLPTEIDPKIIKITREGEHRKQ